jgi:hypothetical protein
LGGRTKGDIALSTSPKKTATELAVERQREQDDFNSREVFDETVDEPQLIKIIGIEDKLEKANYDTDESKLAGLKILLEEEPGIIVGENYPTIFGEKFKLNLFLRMQEFA